MCEREPEVLNFVLADTEGVPSLESFHTAAPLLVLPQSAREEIHR